MGHRQQRRGKKGNTVVSYVIKNASGGTKLTTTACYGTTIFTKLTNK